MRLVVGVMAVLLPVVLLVGDVFVLRESTGLRGSLSAYYHSGMRDFFVGDLFVDGVFLITYRVARWPAANTITTVAGTACLGLAVFPTTGLPGYVPTPLQEHVGVANSRLIHYVCAGVFILALAAISARFGREAQLDQPGSPWAAYHYACAAVIVLACGYIGVTKISGVGAEYSLLFGESAAVLAYGASWTSKGLELQLVLPRSWRRRRLSEPTASPATPTRCVR